MPIYVKHGFINIHRGKVTCPFGLSADRGGPSVARNSLIRFHSSHEMVVTRAPSPISKIAFPVFGGTFPRKRLFRVLDRARKRPIVWISGPAGCGKTTLASTYLFDRKVPCLWYQIDEGDNDVASFFYYMGLAARRAAPRGRANLSRF